MHRRCAGDEALYDSGFKNIIRTEVPALLLKRGRKKIKNPTTDFITVFRVAKSQREGS